MVDPYYVEKRLNRAKKLNTEFEEDYELITKYSVKENEQDYLNYLRLMIIEDKGSLAKIIALTFFEKGEIDLKDFSIKEYEVPVKVKKLADDITPITFLKNEVEMSDVESKYLLLRYRKATVEYLDEVFNLIPTAKDVYSILLDITRQEYAELMRPDHKLKQFGFFDEANEMNPDLLDCINSQELSIYFSRIIKEIDVRNAYELDSFSVSKEKNHIMKNLLCGEEPVSLLLYGKPGSGKTEYAKALSKATGKKALIFKNESETETKDVLGKLNCLLSLNRPDTILIIDEAESVLKTKSYSFFGMGMSTNSKGTVNKMLECSKNKVIWVVNHVDSIEDSTLRRFTLSCKFDSMKPEVLKTIAYKKIDVCNISSNAKEKIVNMFDSYHVTGSSIDNVVKTIKCLKINDDEELLDNVEIVLRENSYLFCGKQKIRENVSDAYDLSVLNTSVQADKIVRMINNAVRFSQRNQVPDNSTNGIRMLFYGLSGTGKTEFARYISEKLNKKILLKRVSDIFDKYVGETEKNIRDAFEEAEANDQILLFDEADSFFADRNMAERNWERTQVNEFLTQMEEFSGILICTTNLRKIMDTAMLRRFHITVEFNPMKPDGISKLLTRYFNSYDFVDEQLDEICRYDSVTPGDFGILSSKIRFMDSDEITSQKIIDELCNIQKEKSEHDFSHCKIGFN